MNLVGKSLTKVFGSRNDRLLKKYRRIVQQINAHEPAARAKSDAELRDRTQEIRRDIIAGKLTIDEVLAEAMAIIRESMDRQIGIREIFNPELSFDPDKLNDEMLQAYDVVQQQMIATGVDYKQVNIPRELYDAVRELYPESRPPFRARCFDVQLIGGIVLAEGKIAEMKTGEGKTFVAPLAAFLRALRGQHTHVVTVNDYLVKRDATWTRPAFDWLGLSVGYLQQTLQPGGQGRKQAYQCDVTYGTNSEFGFDYLRDNMKQRADMQVQGPLDFAIIDEVDSILIDEARTPLIISGEANTGAPKYREADEVARYIMEMAKPWQKSQDMIEECKRIIKGAESDLDKASGKGDKQAAEAKLKAAREKLYAAEDQQAETIQYYEVEMDKKSVHLTHEGIAAAQDKAGVGSFYVGDNMDWPHLMEQAMRAHVVYERDKDYVVEPDPRTGEMGVVIVDEYTGRKMVGRQWSDGLHQAVEAKENVPIKKETQTMATITLQNFFKLYKALAGMTGTAQTEAEEFSKIYKLEVVSIPTNRPVIREDFTDLVYRTEPEKWDSILDDIKKNSDAGRPVLVGTTSVEKSEFLSRLLTKKYGIQHDVLNAKQHEREASIIENAGKQHKNKRGQLVGNVTIATNMAGRGTDIKPAPSTFYTVVSRDGDIVCEQRETGTKVTIPKDDLQLREAFQVDSGHDLVGGLHVVATERHTSRRIDDQLRGRSGRQGDAGSSRFYVSLQDPLMKMFMPEWATNVLKKAGLEYGEPIESRLVTRQIAGAQKKVEERNFLSRKSLLDYDEVMDVQRLKFYGLRQKVLEGREIDTVIWDMIGEAISDAVDKYVAQDYRATLLAEWGRNTFQTQIDPEDLMGLRSRDDVDDLYRQKAKNDVRDTIRSTLGEFMGEDRTDTEFWDTRGLKTWAKSRYGVELTESEIKQIDPDDLEERLTENAYEGIDSVNTDDVEPYLEPLFPLRELCRWANEKFAIGLEPSELIEEEGTNVSKSPADIAEIIGERARAAYKKREIEFPVNQVMGLASGGESTITNDQDIGYLAQWGTFKYGTPITPPEIAASTTAQLRDRFLGQQERLLSDSTVIEAEADKIIAAGGNDPGNLAAAYQKRFGLRLDPVELDPARLSESQKGTKERDLDGDGKIDQRDILIRRARYAIRKELTDLEQYVLISIFDQAWKDHLYAMDVLKGGIGMQAFAERDPRIAYKREGYRYFRQMMEEVRDKVTDLIFRVQVQGQQAPETKDAYGETEAVHAEVDDNAAIAAQAPADEPQTNQPQPAAADMEDKGVGKRQPKKDRNKKGKRR
jgi:preprotein translocase subunit SecA